MKAKLLVVLFLFTFSKANTQSFKELSDSLLFYYQAKNYDKAIPYGEKTLEFVKSKYGSENAVYRQFLQMLGGLYLSDFRYSKAETLFIELKELNRKLSGENSKDYIDAIGVLAVIYSSMGNDSKAAPIFEEAMHFYRRTKGEEDPESISAANRLAKVYEQLGEYHKAATIFQKSIAILEKTGRTEQSSYPTSLNNLGIVYKNLGYPDKAEPLLFQAMEIRKKNSGGESEDYANSLNNLAVLYGSLGQYQKAENYYRTATSIFKKAKGEISNEYLTSLNNLASAYDESGNYDKAVESLKLGLQISEKQGSENSVIKTRLNKSLAQVYLSMEKWNLAETILLSLVEQQEKSNNDDLAGTLNDLAYLYSHNDEFSKAENYYNRSLQLTKQKLGTMHSDYAATLNNLAVLYQRMGRYTEAMTALEEVNKIKTHHLLTLFSILSEEEKANYLATNVFLQHSNLSLLFNFPEAPASFYETNFNLQLLLKGLLLTDTKNVLETVRTSTDSNLQKLFRVWEEYKTTLAREYSLPGSQRNPNLTQIETAAEQVEKELIRRSSGYRDLRAGLEVSMRDIKETLGPDEVAIEFVSFQYFNKEVTDSVIYAALILKGQDVHPVFVPLFEEKQLLRIIGTNASSKVIVNNLYPGKISPDSSSTAKELYELVWQPLEKYLKGIRKINYSLAGKLNYVAIHALATDERTLLIDKYKLHQYVSTRDILLEDAAYKKPGDAALFGNADFFSVRKPVSTNKQLSSTTLFSPDKYDESRVYWVALPGTATEITEIKKILISNKVRTNIKLRNEASEENLKALSGASPEVLFIATHGYFLPEKKKQNKGATRYGVNVLSNSSQPLLRSGLILAGGNNSWSGNPPGNGVEDGIVTAYEISQLDLSKTKLAILSACETGLGDLRGTEGVFGLQRAFKMAGVDNLIVSLWKVPDKETAELMKTFYANWLKGQTIEQAFSAAQGLMRKKYPPYFWAAFVLVH